MNVARWLAMLGALSFLAGCGSGGEKQVTFSTAYVRHVFGAHGARPEWIINTRTTTHADIARRFPLPNDAGSQKAAVIARQGLYDLIDRGAQHPVVWLAYRSVQVFVWGNLADAEAAGSNPGVKRIGNVEVLVPGGKPPRRVAAALGVLSKAK